MVTELERILRARRSMSYWPKDWELESRRALLSHQVRWHLIMSGRILPGTGTVGQW